MMPGIEDLLPGKFPKPLNDVEGTGVAKTIGLSWYCCLRKAIGQLVKMRVVLWYNQEITVIRITLV